MSGFSVQDAKSELAAMLHGTTLNQVENITGVFNRAARQLLLDIDPQETKRTTAMNSPVYYNIYDYALPSDIKGNKVIDLIPLQQRNRRDVVYSTYNQNFDVNKQSNPVNNFSIISDTGNKYIRVAYNNKSLTNVLDEVTAVNDNGLWVASGTASNLIASSQVTNGNSNTLSFDATTGVATLTNSTLQPQDLSTHFNQGCNFFTLYMVDSSKFTSATIKVGSSSGDYYISSALTTQFNGASVLNGYNQFGAKFVDMTKVGTPDLTKISFIELNITFSGSVYGVSFLQIQNSLGFLFNLEYYSKFLFADVATGAWQEKVTDDSNLINLDTESYNIFFYLVQQFSVQQALGQDAGYDTNFSDAWYTAAVARYKRLYKSEGQKVQQSYYNRTFSGYNGLLGRQGNNS